MTHRPRLNPARARMVLILGSVVAAAGAAVIARAPSVPVAMAGRVLAAAGTAALFPTLLSIVSRNVVESSRGRATSIVTVASYFGFLLARSTSDNGHPRPACAAR